MYVSSIFIVLVVVGVQGQDQHHPNTDHGHEKFWAKPDFFASLSDYLMTAPIQPQQPQPQNDQRHHNHQDPASSASELFHTFVKPPPSVTATFSSFLRPMQGQSRQRQTGGGHRHRQDMDISSSELSRIMNFAIASSSPPPEFAKSAKSSRDSYDPYFQQEQDQNVPEIQLMAPPQDGYSPQSQPEYQYQPQAQQAQQEYADYGQGPQLEISLPAKQPQQKLKAQPRPLPLSHPNALSITSLEYKKTSTRRRPPLSAGKDPSSTTITPMSSTSTSTKSSVMSTSTSTSTPTSRSSIGNTTPKTNANGQYRYQSPNIVLVAETPPPRIQYIAVPQPHPQQHVQIAPPRFQIITGQAPQQSNRFRVVSLEKPTGGGRQHLSSNVELLPAQQVYEGMGLPSEAFKVPAPAAQQSPQYGGYPQAAQTQPKTHKPYTPIKLNPNILISTPYQQKSGGSEAQLAQQASNTYPVLEQDENYAQKETGGIVNTISNMLETGRKIFYFPKGVVDVVDQAMTLAGDNPYVNLVMGTLADTILGSTKGMSAAPQTNNANKINKTPTLLIANPQQNGQKLATSTTPKNN